jgi:hypothetical protein
MMRMPRVRIKLTLRKSELDSERELKEGELRRMYFDLEVSRRNALLFVPWRRDEAGYTATQSNFNLAYVKTEQGPDRHLLRPPLIPRCKCK